MIGNVLKKVFGSKNERELNRLTPLVQQINALEQEIQALSDDQLRAKTKDFKERIDQGASLDELLPETYAVVREASVRTLKMRHFDVQLIGGMVLHNGKIAEMRTGEGKTLVATLAAYLNALPGKGVHVVTVKPGYVDTKMKAHKPTPKIVTATPEDVAKAVMRAYHSKKNTVYVLSVWRWVMLIIRNIPEFIFKRMSL